MTLREYDLLERCHREGVDCRMDKNGAGWSLTPEAISLATANLIQSVSSKEPYYMTVTDQGRRFLNEVKKP